MKLLLLDVDGVMTDGTKIYDTNGEVIGKRFCDLDFTAIKKFTMDGWKVIWLSADPKVNQPLAEKRNIEFCNSNTPDGTIDKVYWFNMLREKHSVNIEDIIYVGDDLFDIPLMEVVKNGGGMAYCPSNAAIPVLKVATPLLRRGGEGCIMELYEQFSTGNTPPCN